ncbi:hypothetical protein [Inconstantimicrobium porci]|uniref:Uncharacterized protein n=1 Tax=Inconstantimicrobium porci TaxID=2652291 RepID=A0A7X2T1V4_9CLOT|nr:hypothetical protein [Inconstantimicrobium porci]MDD6771832.1 hypothetical protein [Inconstantimicrobium porci]MSR91979.1 hypothetical protein [Inconstantimicrobium porci]
MADVINKKTNFVWNTKPITAQYGISVSKPDSAVKIGDGSGYGQGGYGNIPSCMPTCNNCSACCLSGSSNLVQDIEEIIL